MAWHSGIGTHIRGLLEGLQELRSFGTQTPPLMVGGDQTRLSALCLGADDRTCALPLSIYGARGAISLPWPPGISLTHYPHFNVPRFQHQPYVVTVHDLIHLRVPEVGGSAAKRLLIRAWLEWAVRRAAHVLTVSEYSREDICREFRLPQDKVTVIGNGVSIAFRPVSSTTLEMFRERHRLKRPFFLTVGIDKPHKNLRWLADSFLKWRAAKKSDMELVMCSPSPMEWTQDLQHVRALGGLPHDDLPALYQSATALLMPSLYEGFGLPVLEAQSVGTPVACSDATSLPGVAGDAALLFGPRSESELHTALDELLNEDTRRRLSAAGLDNIQRFRWRGVAERVLDVWRST